MYYKCAPGPAAAPGARKSTVNPLIRFAFRQFYTRFAWTYDAVASAVSFGEWRRWGRAALEFLPPAGDASVLEIAHGPGHLHIDLRARYSRVVGVDLSPQMSRMARRRVLSGTAVAPNLARADALRLPFPDGAFDAIVSTFPAEFVFAPETLAGVARLLQRDAAFVIVPTAGFRQKGLTTRAVDAAYRATGQRASLATAESRVAERFARAGLTFNSRRVDTPQAEVVVWLAARVSLGASSS
jgi:ubiquinone/menaquinone biosynthesis C-methylase UbiE